MAFSICKTQLAMHYDVVARACQLGMAHLATQLATCGTWPPSGKWTAMWRRPPLGPQVTPTPPSKPTGHLWAARGLQAKRPSGTTHANSQDSCQAAHSCVPMVLSQTCRPRGSLEAICRQTCPGKCVPPATQAYWHSFHGPRASVCCSQRPFYPPPWACE
jgi:hypothetical protein